MLEVSVAEKTAWASGDWKASREAFQRMQDDFHKASNEAKNESLHVDLVEDEFVAPNERITEKMLAEIKDRNAIFLGYAYNEVNVFRRLEKAPDAESELISGFVKNARS